MNVVGVLVFWDESPTWLSSCVSGFGRVCDTIVALDGAYALLPGGKARSHPEQSHAIQDACEAVGAGLVLHRPREVFYGNEVEKRQLSLELARPLDPDWILVFDSDYLVVDCNPEMFRYDLEHTVLNAGAYRRVDSLDVQADPDAAWLAKHLPLASDTCYEARGIYRWAEDLAYGPTHYDVIGTFDGVRQSLHGQASKGCPPVADAVDVGGSLVCVHRREQRPLLRLQAAERYYAARDSAGIERSLVEA